MGHEGGPWGRGGEVGDGGGEGRGRQRAARCGRGHSAVARRDRSSLIMSLKQFKRSEITARNNKLDAVFIIDNQVYDVTKFLDDHPGGHEVLLNNAGKDATEEFDDIGHSLDAKELMKKFLIGEVVAEERIQSSRSKNIWSAPASEEESGNFFTSWKFPVVLGLIATVLYSYLFS